MRKRAGNREKVTKISLASIVLEMLACSIFLISPTTYETIIITHIVHSGINNLSPCPFHLSFSSIALSRQNKIGLGGAS